MKKCSIGVGIVCLLLTVFLLPACNYTLSGDIGDEDILSLEGPKNVVATNDYPGLIRLTWDVNYNAKGYSVFRDGREIATVNRDHNYYEDYATYKNPLANGNKYTYVITANSGQSTSKRGVGLDEIMFDGVSQPCTITPENIPEVGSPMSDIEEIKVEQDGNFVNVSWNTTPTAKYTVYHYTGIDAIAGEIGSIFDSEDVERDVLHATTASLKFPLQGGNNAFIITAAYRGDAAYYKAFTSPSSELSYVLSTFTLTNSDAGFAATRRGNNTAVDLSWNEHDNDSTYTVYRARLNISQNAIMGGWEALTGAKESYEDSGEKKWRMIDYNAPLENTYRYMLVVTDAAGSRSKGITADVEFDETFVAPTFTFTPVITIDGATRSAKVEIMWDWEAGETYTLSRATVKFDDSAAPSPTATNFTVLSEYADIYTTTGEDEGSAVYVDSPSTARDGTYYRYKLVAKKGNTTSLPRYSNLTIAPFIGRSDVTLVVATHATIPYAVTFALSGNESKFYATKDNIQIFRRVKTSDNRPYVLESEFELVNLTYDYKGGYDTASANGNGDILAQIDVSLDNIGYQGDNIEYEYKVVVGGLDNIPSNTDYIKPITLNTAPTFTALAPTALSSTNVREIQYDLSGGSYTEQADIEYRYRSSDISPGDLSNNNWSEVAVKKTDTDKKLDLTLSGNTIGVTYYEVQIRAAKPQGRTAEGWQGSGVINP